MACYERINSLSVLLYVCSACARSVRCANPAGALPSLISGGNESAPLCTAIWELYRGHRVYKEDDRKRMEMERKIDTYRLIDK